MMINCSSVLLVPEKTETLHAATSMIHKCSNKDALVTFPLSNF